MVIMLPAAETIFKIVVSLTCAATKKSAGSFRLLWPQPRYYCGLSAAADRTHVLVYQYSPMHHVFRFSLKDYPA